MNGTMFQGFEWYLEGNQKHWETIRDMAADLSAMGVTAVWLPPAYKGAQGNQDVGYGVYDLYDLGEFDQKGSVATKYGTKECYLEAIRELQKQGIYVLADIVLNQRMGADEEEEVEVIPENMMNRGQIIGGNEKIRVYSKFTCPGRNGKYSNYQWSHKDFDGADWDSKNQRKGLFRFAGTTWEQDVDSQYGNYDYLMGVDVSTDTPCVIQELDSWIAWYLETTGVDGFRLDAVKHISSYFYDRWLTKIRNTTGKELFAVGEYWSFQVDSLKKYLANTNYKMSLFDVALHQNLYQASKGGGYYDMRKLIDSTLLRENPIYAVTFVDNHDTQPGQALESYVETWFRPIAYALILLWGDGYPCVFWGDLCGLNQPNIEPMSEIEQMIRLRKDYAYGPRHEYFDHWDIVGFTREGGEQAVSGLAVLMTDGPGGQKRMYVGKRFRGDIYMDVLNKCGQRVTIDEDGCGNFYVEGGSVSVYKKDDRSK